MTLKTGCHRLMYTLTHQSSMLGFRSRGHLLLSRLGNLDSKTSSTSCSWFSTGSALNMRLVQFTDLQGGPQKLGVQPQQDGEITDISSGSGKIPNDLIKLIQGGPELWAEAEKAAAKSSIKAQAKDVKLLAPLTAPGKVICVGLNYRCHCNEQHIEPPHEPMFFSKFASCIVGPTDNVVLPTVSTKVDWEVEMVVVIGKQCRNLKPENTMENVFGYTIAQDISARDWQKGRNGGQWLLGKSMDTFCPLGPAVVTAGDFPKGPHVLPLSCSINGVKKQDSNTDQLIHQVDYIISHLSHLFALLPGDIILTGTPAGVGVFRNPREFLKPGDVIDSEVVGIGKMRNPVVAPQ